MIKPRNTYRSGTGAAHLGFAMFGARGPLLSPEGDGGGSSSAATTEGAAGSAATSGAGGDGAAAKTFTQAEVDQIVKDRLAKVKQAAPAPQQQTRQTSTDDAGEKPLTMKELQAQLLEEKARREFDRRAAKLGLQDEVADDLFALSQVQKPADVGAWLEAKSKLFGSGATKGSEAAGTTQTAQTETQQQQVAAAPNAPGAVQSFVDHGGQVDIYRMTAQQAASMTGGQLRAIHERNVQIAQGSSGAPPVPRFGVQPKR